MPNMKKSSVCTIAHKKNSALLICFPVSELSTLSTIPQ